MAATRVVIAKRIFNKIVVLEKRIERITKNKKFEIINRVISNKEDIEVEAEKIDNLSDYYPMLSYFGSKVNMEYRYVFNEYDKIVIQEYINSIDGVKG